MSAPAAPTNSNSNPAMSPSASPPSNVNLAGLAGLAGLNLGGLGSNPLGGLGGLNNVGNLASNLGGNLNVNPSLAGLLGARVPGVPGLPNPNLSALLSALQGGVGAQGIQGMQVQNPGGWSGQMPVLGGLPASSLSGPFASSPAALAALGQLPPAPPQSEEDKIYALILDLTNPTTRESALLELSKKREAYEDLAPILWHSYGVISALLQEIIAVYPILFPPTLTGHASNRVCNTLALLQCVASHPETRGLFLNAHIPLFLYPFLNTTSKTRPFEYLRLTSLGVIGALVKNDNTEVIQFLLSTEIVPLCLRIMESGSELSKTVAIFIVQKILLDDSGLSYICQTYERFYAVATVLNSMVSQLVESGAGSSGGRLLKHVVRCYLRLSDNPRAREALRQCLPDPLRDGTFGGALKDDMTTRRVLQTLLANLGEGGGVGM